MYFLLWHMMFIRCSTECVLWYTISFTCTCNGMFCAPVTAVAMGLILHVCVSACTNNMYMFMCVGFSLCSLCGYILFRVTAQNHNVHLLLLNLRIQCCFRDAISTATWFLKLLEDSKFSCTM